jgi:hypothetical protein
MGCFTGSYGGHNPWHILFRNFATGQVIDVALKLALVNQQILH